MQSFQRQILLFSVVLLVLVVLAIQMSSWWLTSRHNQQQVHSLLNQANRYINDTLNARQEALRTSAQVLTGDFGFKQAVASGDLATINSMLDNHAARIHADLMVLTDLQGTLIASNQDAIEPTAIETIHYALQSADTGPQFVELAGHFYRVFLIPVLAPRQIADCLVGYEVDAGMLERLREVTQLDLSLRASNATLLSSLTLATPTIEAALDAPEQEWSYWRRPDLITERISIPTLASQPVEFFIHIDISAFYQDFDQLSRAVFGTTLGIVLVGILLSTLGSNQIANTLHTFQQSLLYKASYDPLTAVMNRGTVMEALAKEMARTQRQHLSLCVAWCDLDHFKRVNDTYGHAAGDQVLKAFAATVRELLREYDLIGRYGGEEFVIAMQADELQAHLLFERLRQAVAATVVEHAGQRISVTMSCGVCVLPADHAHDAIKSVLEIADEALYSAKDQGRNRVVFAPSPTLKAMRSSTGA